MPDELLVLGSSDGLPNGRRFSSAYTLTVAGKLYLLDCGARSLLCCITMVLIRLTCRPFF